MSATWSQAAEVLRAALRADLGLPPEPKPIWQFGDEGWPALRVSVQPEIQRMAYLVRAGDLPRHHPLALALDTLAFAEWWDPRWARCAMITEQAAKRHSHAWALVRWYERHQDILNAPSPYERTPQ